MAQRGTPISAHTIKRIQRLRQVLSIRKTAREVGVSPATVVRYTSPQTEEKRPQSEQ